jgi:protocatechuate 3,4-dioxygenase beta subunit
MKSLLAIAFVFLFIYRPSGSDFPSEHTPTGGRSHQTDPPDCQECLFDEVPRHVSWRVTIPSDTVRGRRIKLSGTVFRSDGKTPAAGTLLYVYHTNATGRYAKLGTEDRRSYAWWHGYLRGWLKTDAQGRYEINTIRPAPYPTRDEPAHIHAVARAPGQQSQPVSEFVFRDDPLVTDSYWYRGETREGQVRYAGVTLKPGRSGVLDGHRDLVLHPAFDPDGRHSGLLVGTECPAFDPQHAWGADRGTHACPMCKYGYRTAGVLAWFGDDDWGTMARLAFSLEREIERRGAGFRAFLVYTNPKKEPAAEVTRRLEAFARANGLRNVALLHVPSPDDKPSSFLYRINPRARNTILLYRQRRVVGKFVNWVPTQQASLESAIASVAATGR